MCQRTRGLGGGSVMHAALTTRTRHERNTP